ncbi:MAG TPA: hypothetical protein PLS82_17435 [Phycisphaerae bacterium]|nr:hypothetical protein [Phycisphaerae bacterium]
MLRGVVACVALLGGVALLAYGAMTRRTVTLEEKQTILVPPQPPDPRLVDANLRRGLPPPPGEPARTEERIVRTQTLDPEWRLVRDVTVGGLQLGPEGLMRIGLGDGPALCPT